MSSATRCRRYHFQVMRADGAVQSSSATMSVPPTLKELRTTIEPILGATMMHVAVEHGSLFVDELAYAKGLPRNERATVVYREASLLAVPGILVEALPFIAGPAVLFEG